MTYCRFCILVKGEDFCYKIHEDKLAFAFMDKSPVNKGHVLVIPKQHISNFEDLNEKSYLHLMRLVKKISKVIKKITKCQKVGILIAGFHVKHTHVHVIPMNDIKDVATRRVWENNFKPASNKDLKDISKLISKKISANKRL